MTTLPQSLWTVRLVFALLLLMLCEFLIWGGGSAYAAEDWVARALIYFALATLLLDFASRYHITEWKSIYLLGGMFGLLHALTMTELNDPRLEFFLRDFIVLPLGAMPLMFLVAFWVLHLFLSGEATGPSAFFLALLLGFIGGTWLNWYPQLDDINIATATLTETLPILLLGLVFTSMILAALPPPPQNPAETWQLSVYQIAAFGLVIVIPIIIRLSDGILSLAGFGSPVAIIAMTTLLLVATRGDRHSAIFPAFHFPKTPLLIGFFLLLIALGVGYGLGYVLSDTSDEPIQATLILNGMLVWGALWLPIVCTIYGVRLMTQLTREGY